MKKNSRKDFYFEELIGCFAILFILILRNFVGVISSIRQVAFTQTLRGHRIFTAALLSWKCKRQQSQTGRFREKNPKYGG